MDREAQVRKLVDTVSPRTAHQYKSYGDKYIRWLREAGLVQQLGEGEQGEGELLYRDLPLSAYLIHWFLIDTLVRSGEEVGDEEDAFKIPTLKKVISSLKFLHRLCGIHGNQSVLDEKYLEGVIKLHSNWATVRSRKETTLPVVKVSLNLWNPSTENLSEKFFKTSLEKLRFLVDFHFRVYTNLSYEQRSRIKLAELHAEDDGTMAMDQKVWSSLQVYMPNSTRQVKSHMPMSIRHQSMPLLCPMTALASYLYLRFYGISSLTKGDGFPDLLASDQDDLFWQELPLIRGKSLLDYPREETLSNYYSAVFRYCHLPYKRREYFNKSALEYPTWTHQSFTDFFDKYPKASATAFENKVPFDYDRIMNFRPPKELPSEKNEGLDTLPESLLVQVFPEIEEYKRKIDQLSPEARTFLRTMENLRKRLVYNLPWIHSIFPQHDLFKDPIFHNPDFQSYFHQVAGNKWENGQLPFDVMPGFERLNKVGFCGLLMESSEAPGEEQTPAKATAQASEPSVTSEELMDKTYQFVQYQTLTNFQLLLSLLSKIFDKLEMRKSSREFMIHQLDLLHDTIRRNIDVSKPQDVEKYIKKEEKVEEEEAKKPSKESQSGHRSNGLLAIDDSPSEDSDDGGVQEELQFMINELVGERVRSTVKLQMEQWESKIQDMVKVAVREEVTKRFAEHEESARKRPRLSSTPPTGINEYTPSIPAPASEDERDVAFVMNPDLDTVEAVILEWFTPNPKMNGKCVHSMNKHGKAWRSSFEKLYKERKTIVEFYIHLVNQLGVNRYKAVEICEILRRSTESDGSLASLAKLLKEWKRKNENTYDGLLEHYKLSAV